MNSPLSWNTTREAIGALKEDSSMQLKADCEKEIAVSSTSEYVAFQDF